MKVTKTYTASDSTVQDTSDLIQAIASGKITNILISDTDSVSFYYTDEWENNIDYMLFDQDVLAHRMLKAALKAALDYLSTMKELESLPPTMDEQTN